MVSDPYERFWDQLDEVKLKQPDKRFKVSPPEAERGSGVAPEYVYEARRILCRKGHLGPIRRDLGVPNEVVAEITDDLTVLAVADDVDIPARARAVNAARAAELGGPERQFAGPNHVVSITPVNMCPADEPVPVDRDAQPWPPRVTDPAAGAGIRILVVDTGLFPGFLDGHPWLASAEPVDGLRQPLEASGLIKEYAGHGTFISGVIGCVAPGATIQASKALENGGALTETQLGTRLLEVLGDGEWPHIISLSAGSPTMDGLPLMGLQDFLTKLAEHPKTVLIAAAGNDAKRDDVADIHDELPYHFWPAACAPTDDGVVSVGALRRHAGNALRACFSNFGTSVTVYARGEEHINAFLHGEYEYHHGLDAECHNHEPPLYCPCSCVTSLPRHAHAVFQGMARWSGTSFATPLVAGRLAAYMTEIGERDDARSALHDMIAKEAREVTDVDGERLRAFL
jgi:subtilisin family serine protease